MTLSWKNCSLQGRITGKYKWMCGREERRNEVCFHHSLTRKEWIVLHDELLYSIIVVVLYIEYTNEWNAVTLNMEWKWVFSLRVCAAYSLNTIQNSLVIHQMLLYTSEWFRAFNYTHLDWEMAGSSWVNGWIYDIYSLFFDNFNIFVYIT